MTTHTLKKKPRKAAKLSKSEAETLLADAIAYLATVWRNPAHADKFRAAAVRIALPYLDAKITGRAAGPRERTYVGVKERAAQAAKNAGKGTEWDGLVN